ncbi:MAG: hypothetical protein JWM27_4192 [Gemmatimonadetes bacterium]|nr:hypothetical protein [Gemmatimonadota bacterium]
MKPVHRAFTWFLAAFYLAAAALVQLVLYPHVAVGTRALYSVALLLYGALGVVSVRARPRDVPARVFVGAGLATALTFVAYPFAPALPADAASTVYVLLFNAPFLLTSALMFHMSAVLPEENPVVRQHPGIIRHAYVAACVLDAFGLLVYLNAAHHWTGWLPGTQAGAWAATRGMVMGFYSAATLSGSALVAWSGRRAASTAARRQATALCAGLAPFGVFRLVNFAVPGFASSPVFQALEGMVIFLLPLGMFLAVCGFRLFEGPVYLRRGVLTTLTLLLLLAAGFTLAATVGAALAPQMSAYSASAVLCLALGLVLWPAVRHVGEFVDTLFFPERLLLRQLTAQILERVAESTDIRVLAGAFTATVSENLGVDAAFYVAGVEGAPFAMEAATGRAEGYAPRTLLPPASADAAACAGPSAACEKAPFVDVVPIAFRGRVNALLALGRKASGESLSRDELRELGVASVQVAAMVENARLFALATRDGLTLLLRRPVFEEQLALEAARFARDGTPFSLLLFDVDDFKRVNDTRGHLAGDEALRRVSGAVAANSRDMDVVARYGGEELVALLPGATAEVAAGVADRMRRAVADVEAGAEGGPLHVTVSVGVAEMEAGLAPQQLVARADAALYRAKHAGKNRVEMHGAAAEVGQHAVGVKAEPA